MIEPELEAFVGGALATGYLIVGLFFCRFWALTRDKLFAAFAFAFGLLATSQTILTFQGSTEEDRAPIYLLRLAAFGLIIGAVLAKNIWQRRADG